jgi:hypothetical protein
MKRHWMALAVSLIGAFTHAPARCAPADSSPDEAYLDRLQGQWVMKGTVGSQPVRYRAEGRRILQGGFLSLHMRDVAAPPQYEASVFLGYDSKAKDYVAHWLDRFGAAGARVVATGHRDGDRLVLIFPYPEGAFRDTFSWHRDTATWTLLIESQSTDASWKTFASYKIVRPPHSPP